MFLSLRARCCLGLMLACSVPGVGAAQSMPMGDMPGAPALGADAAIGVHGRLWVVSVRDGHVLLRHAGAPGKALGAPVAVNRKAEAIDAQRENAPKIALGGHGTIYVSWVHPRAKQWSSEVRFARSTDGGKSFSVPVTVSDGPADTTHGFHAMAVAGNGDIVIAWLDGRGMTAAMAAGTPHHGLSLHYTWSADGGRTFAPSRRLMDHTCECCRVALARTAGGHVAVFFRAIFGDNIRDHAFGVLRTDAQPDHWQRATWSQWRIAACPEQGPALAIGGDGVRHAVWYEASHGPAIWYGQLQPGHAPAHVVRIGGAGAGHADVAVHGHTVWVAWNQVGADGYRLLLRVSHDDGAHFGGATVIAASRHGVGSPRLLVRGGKAWVAWNTLDGFRVVPAGSR